MNVTQALHKQGLLEDIEFCICSVGAREVGGHPDINPEWLKLGEKLSIYGFEADEDECERLNQKNQEDNHKYREIYIPKALSKNVGVQELFVTAWNACTSLYPPNEKFCDRFKGIGKVSKLTHVSKVRCSTLDTEFDDSTQIDFLKIDVQGADLDVLLGGQKKVLPNVLAIQVEVQFNPLYVGIPLFADVDTFLRSQGYSLLCVDTASGIRRISHVTSNKYKSAAGQLLFGDAFYFRDILESDLSSQSLNPETLLKTACVLDCIYPERFIDICIEYLVTLATLFGDTSCNRWFEIEEAISSLSTNDFSSTSMSSDSQDFPALKAIHQARILSEQLHNFVSG